MSIKILTVLFLAVFASAVDLIDANPAGGPGKTATCKDGMEMVKKYLEVSKIELIKNIREAKKSQCKAQAWRKVDRSMVSHSHSVGVSHTLATDASGGLEISATVTNNGCGKGKGSNLVVHIKGEWKQIMYTQVFKGAASCWGVFGNKYDGTTLDFDAGLEVFNPSFGDIIFGQKKMGSKTADTFVGKTRRCDNDNDNFWHGTNGSGERQATVMLRRKHGAKHSGIQTDTSCGTPQYVIKDIFALE